MVELGNWLHRWIFIDFFVPVWPNVAAAALLAVHIKKSNEKHSSNAEPKREHIFYLGEKEGPDEGD